MSETAILDLGELRGQFTLEIFDIKGQFVRQQTMNLDQGTLNLTKGELTSGHYLLRISNEDGQSELKFVVE